VSSIFDTHFAKPYRTTYPELKDKDDTTARALEGLRPYLSLVSGRVRGVLGEHSGLSGYSHMPSMHPVLSTGCMDALIGDDITTGHKTLTVSLYTRYNVLRQKARIGYYDDTLEALGMHIQTSCRLLVGRVLGDILVEHPTGIDKQKWVVEAMNCNHDIRFIMAELYSVIRSTYDTSFYPIDASALPEGLDVYVGDPLVRGAVGDDPVLKHWCTGVLGGSIDLRDMYVEYAENIVSRRLDPYGTR
jgi:hypothetical protein